MGYTSHSLDSYWLAIYGCCRAWTDATDPLASAQACSRFLAALLLPQVSALRSAGKALLVFCRPFMLYFEHLHLRPQGASC